MSNQMMIQTDDSLECTYLSSKCMFTFEHIGQLRQSYPSTECINSDIIKDVSQFMNADVYVQFYPCGNGSPASGSNYGELDLHIVPKNMDKRFYVKFSFATVDDGDEGYSKRTFKSIKPVSQKKTFSWGCNKFVKLVQDDGMVKERLTVEVDLEIFTERTYLRWLNLYPNNARDIDSNVLYDSAVAFNNQSLSENEVTLIEVDNGQIKKTIKVSNKIVSEASDVFKTRLTSKMWTTGKNKKAKQTYKLSGYDPVLVNKFFKSIHTGILTYDDFEDQLDLLEISNEYQVDWIKEKVCNLIEKSLELENNCIQCFIRADQCNASDIREKCQLFCVKNYHQLKDTEEWKELKMNHNDLFVEVLEQVANKSSPRQKSHRVAKRPRST